MQTTNALYQQIVAGEHTFETKVNINGYDYSASSIRRCKITRRGLKDNLPSIGGCLSATLQLEMDEPNRTIPKRAAIIVYVRAKNDSQTSDWFTQGTFYIDTRRVSRESGSVHTVSFVAYDAMAKAEKAFPSTSHAWPARDNVVVNDIATAMGVELDSRTSNILTAGTWMDLPADYTQREVLGYIAAFYAANWVITPENKLLLVPLYGLDLDNITGNYLADSNGTTALQAGNEGWFILV